MSARKVEALLIFGGNPVYTAPADIDFKSALAKVKWRAHLSLYDNETSEHCQWHIPAAHYLESWSDTRAYDGTTTIVQPLIAPLYGGRTVDEIFAILNNQPVSSPYSIVKEYWWARSGASADFDSNWQTWVHDGVVPNTAAKPAAGAPAAKTSTPAAAQNAGQGIEINIRPDLTAWDGAFANNAWLQEMPNPITTTTWENSVWMSLDTAHRLGITDGEIVELKYRGRSVQGPAQIVPGHAKESVTIHLGYGRWRAGHVGDGAGFNAYKLQTSDAPGGGYGGENRKVGGNTTLAARPHTHS